MWNGGNGINPIIYILIERVERVKITDSTFISEKRVSCRVRVAMDFNSKQKWPAKRDFLFQRDEQNPC